MLSGLEACKINLGGSENLVLLKISVTSEFLLNSSPSFSPDDKCAQTKQKLVPCIIMLMEIDPCPRSQATNHFQISITIALKLQSIACVSSISIGESITMCFIFVLVIVPVMDVHSLNLRKRG